MSSAYRESQQFSHKHSHAYLGTEHILLGLMSDEYGVAAHVLKNFDLTYSRVRMKIKKNITSVPEMVTINKRILTVLAQNVIENATEEVQLLNHHYVGTEHLLLSLLREEESFAVIVLKDLELSTKEIREEVLNILGHGL